MNLPKSILELMKCKGIDAAEAIHAAQHAILNQTYLSSDLRIECKAPKPQKEHKPREPSRKRPAR
jgi:DEAD/DEAH box helicase domain-containing protein